MNGWASIRTGSVKSGALVKLKYEVCIYKLLCFQNGYSRVLQSVGPSADTGPGNQPWHCGVVSKFNRVISALGDDRNKALKDESESLLQAQVNFIS